MFAGPGLGHYQPVSELLEEIAGERQVFVAVNLPNESPVMARIRADGFEPIALRSNTSPKRLDRGLGYLARRIERGLVPWLAERAAPGPGMPPLAARVAFASAARMKPLLNCRKSYLDLVHQVIEQTQPTLVLTDINCGEGVGRVARVHQVEWIEYCTGPLIAGRSLRSPVAPGLPPIPTLSDMGIRAALITVDRMRTRRANTSCRRAIPLAGHNTGRVQPVAPLHRVTFSSDALDAPEGFPSVSGWEHLGVGAFKATTAALEHRPQKTVFVTMGSSPLGSQGAIPDALLLALEILADEGIAVRIQTSSDHVHEWATAHPDLPIDIIPPSVRPPHGCYQDSDVVVTHGGWGTIRESVAHGVPVLVMPSIRGDRMDTAQRVIRSGVGVVQSPYAIDPQALTALVRFLLTDNVVRDRVRNVAATLTSNSRRAHFVDSIR